MCHSEFGISYFFSFHQFQLSVYEMISEMCNPKYYTVLLENKFLSPNFPEMYSVGKSSFILKLHLALSWFFPIISCHDCNLCAPFHFVSCTLVKRGCIHQHVHVCRNCLKRYLICGWLYRSQHDKFEKHGFELKNFSLIFSKLNQIKINKTGLKLRAYVSLQILFSP